MTEQKDIERAVQTVLRRITPAIRLAVTDIFREIDADVPDEQKCGQSKWVGGKVFFCELPAGHEGRCEFTPR